MSVGTVALVIPYLVYNYLIFGRFAPISGSLKSTFPVVSRFEIDIFYGFSINLITFTAAAYLLFVLFNKKTYTTQLTGVQILLLAFSAGIILHYIYFILFLTWGVFGWHFMLFYLFVAVLVCELYERFSNRQPGSRWVFNAALVLLSSIFVLRLGEIARVDPDQDFRPVSYQAAKLVEQTTDPDTIFAMTDAGVFGYFSRRRVINLDGLVNDFKFQEYLREKKLDHYLEEEGVDYFVQHAMWFVEEKEAVHAGGYELLRLPIFSYMYQTDSDPINLYERNEIYRHPFGSGSNATVFVIWKMTGDTQNP
jgi:hypothetical protein